MDGIKPPGPDMTPWERSWGIRYLLFQLIFLPQILVLLNDLTGRLLSTPWLNVVFFTVNFGAVGWIFRAFWQKTLQELPQTWKKSLALAALGLGAYYLTALALDWVLTRLYPGFGNVNDASVYQSVQLEYLPMALGTVFLVPVAEESLYRGVVFRGLWRWSRPWAYAISAVVFCAVHVLSYVGRYEPALLALNFLQYLPAGLILAWAYEKSGSIACPILIHMGVNAWGMISVLATP